MTIALESYVMTEAEAHAVTEEIRHAAKSFVEYRARMMEAVDRAKAGNAHEALGYKSWTAYLADVLGEEPMRLARGERQDMVRMLSDEGMSTRAIAPIVGSSFKTVARDLEAPVSNDTPEPDPTANTETEEVSEDYEPEPPTEHTPVPPKTVTGMDGKTYAKPKAMDHIKGHRTARTPLYITARNAGMDLRKSVERITNVMEDDRLTKNKEQVAELISVYLSQAVEVCQDALDQLS